MPSYVTLRQSSDVSRLKARWTLADQPGQPGEVSASTNLYTATSSISTPDATDSSASCTGATAAGSTVAATTTNQSTPQQNVQVGGVLNLDFTPPTGKRPAQLNLRVSTVGEKYAGVAGSATGARIGAEPTVPFGRLLENAGPEAQLREPRASLAFAPLAQNSETRMLEVGGSGMDSLQLDGGYEDRILGVEYPAGEYELLAERDGGKLGGVGGSAASLEPSCTLWGDFGERRVS